VVLPPDFSVLGVDDSKKLSEKRREELDAIIREEALAYGLGFVDNRTIDEINILEATKLAMRLAALEAARMLASAGSSPETAGRPADGLLGTTGGTNDRPPGTDGVTTDVLPGTVAELPAPPAPAAAIEHVLVDALHIPGLDMPQTAIIKGDERSVSIAAASIVAKVARDRLMRAYHERYPAYAFDKNKGYGTKAHIAAIAAEGLCPLHRRSFCEKFVSFIPFSSFPSLFP
jgi:ribonuclease HII